jgi:tyrosyl-tRNA synthetase
MYFTEIEIEELEKIYRNEKNINNLKILLANETTTLLHGKDAAAEAASTAKETFQGMGIGKNLPEIIIKKNELEKGINILDLLIISKIMLSKSEARRTIRNKGIKINDKIIGDENKVIEKKDFNIQNYIKVSYGKKKHYIIKYS